jgi:CRISPR/Cas system-associated protein endoribonuclease Cas2
MASDIGQGFQLDAYLAPFVARLDRFELGRLILENKSCRGDNKRWLLFVCGKGEFMFARSISNKMARSQLKLAAPMATVKDESKILMWTGKPDNVSTKVLFIEHKQLDQVFIVTGLVQFAEKIIDTDQKQESSSLPLITT